MQVVEAVLQAHNAICECKTLYALMRPHSTLKEE